MAATAHTARAAARQDTPPRYSMTLQWDAEDRIFVVSVPELPGLHTHGATYAEAARKGAALIEEWVAVLTADDQPLPAVREWHP